MTSRAQQVAAAIEDELLRSGAAVGSPLGRRTDLMAAHGVSPTVMNEALRILRDRDLVTVRPGPGGGVFVASRPPQLRLGALDLWFTGAGTDPAELFEARAHLEELLTRVAVERAGPQDVRAMEWALEGMRSARDDPRAYLDANMRLHLAIARAARIPVLAGMYEAIVAVLQSTLVRVTLVDGNDELVAHNVGVHEQIVAAVRDGDAAALDKVLDLHRLDLVRGA